MAIQHARVCGACERECPSWANRCPACGSTAISFQMIISPPGGSSSVHQLADSAQRKGRARLRTTAAEPAVTVRSSA
jgi:predicted ATP-dependent serine protease